MMRIEQAGRRGSSGVTKALIVILGVAVVGSTLAIAQRPSDYRFFDPLIDVKNIITAYAAAEPDAEALQRAAIEGMVEALDDPYAVYVPARFTREFEKQMTGEYVGIGAEVNMINGVFTIVTPMDDSPAFRAGVMAGDRVREIDGEPTEGLTIEECIDRLMGEDGTDVVITVERQSETVEITITRTHIRARAIRGFKRMGGEEARWDYLLDEERRIGYVRISQFTPSVAEEFRAALVELGADRGELNGLVIDVRWNPGGLLEQAIRMADLFLDGGVIVSTRGRAYPEQIARASARGTLPDFPVAMLINGQSASASEVLAGALVENGRAIAVGERTFGKGSVQSVHPLGGSATGASLKLTEQRYYLPSGRSLERTDESAAWGVDPTPGFFVPVEDEELVELVRHRREAEILRQQGEAAPDNVDPSWIAERLKDRQFAEALRAVVHHVETGEWPTPETVDPGYTVATQEMDRARRTRERLLRELRRIDRRLEALESGTDAPARSAWDLWDDSAQIVGGNVVVRDAEGNTIATLRITGPDLERWLIDADVEPM